MIFRNYKPAPISPWNSSLEEERCTWATLDTAYNSGDRKRLGIFFGLSMRRWRSPKVPQRSQTFDEESTNRTSGSENCKQTHSTQSFLCAVKKWFTGRKSQTMQLRSRASSSLESHLQSNENIKAASRDMSLIKDNRNSEPSTQLQSHTLKKLDEPMPPSCKLLLDLEILDRTRILALREKATRKTAVHSPCLVLDTGRDDGAFI